MALRPQTEARGTVEGDRAVFCDYADRDLGSPRFMFNATQISCDGAYHHLFSYFRASPLESKSLREFEACVSCVQPVISGAFKELLCM